MNNAQPYPQNQYVNTQFQNPHLIQSLQEENKRLKLELQQNKDNNIQITLKLQNEKKEMDQKIQKFQQLVYQQNQELESLRKTEKEYKKIFEDQKTIKDHCIELQLINQDQMNQLNQLMQSKQIVTIKSKPRVNQQQKEETVRLRFTQKMNNIQMEYQRKGQVIEFQGYGESGDQCFIFSCQCQLFGKPIEGQAPQIIQKDYEINIKFQINI